MGNIVIVHYLPNIIAPCELDLAFIDVEDEVGLLPVIVADADPENPVLSEDPLPVILTDAAPENPVPSEDPFPVILADADPENSTLSEGPPPVILADTDTASLEPLEGPPNDPLTDVNFLNSLGSGGAVIDFDYARSTKGQDSVKASVSIKPSFGSFIYSLYIGHGAVHVSRTISLFSG